MAVQYNPGIVTDGLVLYLDAANRKSYPGTGTGWNNLSTFQGNGIFQNGITFSNLNGGTLVLDGSDDYISFSSGLSLGSGNFSIEFVFNLSTITGNQYFYDFGTNNGVLQYANLGGFVLRYLTQATSIKDTSYTLNQNTNYHITVTRNTGTGYLYLNTSLINNWSDTETYTSSTLNIGRYGGGSGFNMNGNIYLYKVYNKALSSTEIQQNFNALRGRFGI
jgi:hypothetical protein